MYITKPFHVPEFVVRVDAAMRRLNGNAKQVIANDIEKSEATSAAQNQLG